MFVSGAYRRVMSWWNITHIMIDVGAGGHVQILRTKPASPWLVSSYVFVDSSHSLTTCPLTVTKVAWLPVARLVLTLSGENKHNCTVLYQSAQAWFTYQNSAPKTGTGFWRVWHAICYRIFLVYQFMVTKRTYSHVSLWCHFSCTDFRRRFLVRLSSCGE